MKRHTLSTYRLINSIISNDNNRLALEAQLQQHSYWEQLVYHSSAHLILPSLYKRLHQKQLLHCLPEDLITYLQYIHQSNYERNLDILKQIKDLHALLKTAGIRHVFLKGAAFLIKGEAHNQLERMVGDIDVLIPTTQLQEAYHLLKQNGYDHSKGFSYEVKNYRHLDRQTSDNYIAVVELHDALLTNSKKHLLQAHGLLDRATICNGLPIPHAHDMGLHSVLAYQINDLGYYFKGISLKTWNDVIALQLLQDAQFITTLKHHKYGRLFLAWAPVLNINNNIIFSNLRQILACNYLKFKLMAPFYANIVFLTKKGLFEFGHRLLLWSTNKSYRRHVLKNKLKKR